MIKSNDEKLRSQSDINAIVDILKGKLQLIQLRVV